MSVLCFGYVTAQDIEIYKEGTTTDLTGTTIYATWDGDFQVIKKILTIKNVSNEVKTLQVTRVKIDEVSGAEDYLCWGKSLDDGQCYSKDDVTPENPWTTPHIYSFVPNEDGILYVYHIPNGNDGSAKYKYYIEEDGTVIDSIEVVYNYFLSTPEQKPASFLVYPNPAKNILNIDAANVNSSSSNMTLYDISGKMIVEHQIDNGKTQLDISGLNHGVYFYTIRSNNAIIETKKLVIL